MNKTRKRGRGRPIPRINQDKLNCIYCNNTQERKLIEPLFKNNSIRKCYACDHCKRSLSIYKSKNGHFSVQNNTHRWLKNKELGINHIK